VREAEKLVALTVAAEEGKPKKTALQRKSRDLSRLEDELADVLSAAVNIKVGRGGRGQLTIDFGSLDALDGIIARLRHEAHRERSEGRNGSEAADK